MSDGSAREAPSEPARIGRVLRPHGLRGELVVQPEHLSPVPCREGSEVWLAGACHRVARCRIDSRGRWLIALEGVADRDAAEALRGAEVFSEAAELPELEQDNYYIHDLIGCRVHAAAGGELGEVVGVVRGPQDQLEVEREGRRALVPMARALLREVDLQERRIVIDAPPGLIEATSD